MAELIVEQRRKEVAETLSIQVDWAVSTRLWPEAMLLRYKDALVAKTAQLGQAAKEPIYSMAKTRLMAALATNDINAIEALLFELLEAQ